ncbi:unnamed protein product [Ectocarpus sp. 12 AP-2014]
MVVLVLAVLLSMLLLRVVMVMVMVMVPCGGLGGCCCSHRFYMPLALAVLLSVGHYVDFPHSQHLFHGKHRRWSCVLVWDGSSGLGRPYEGHGTAPRFPRLRTLNELPRLKATTETDRIITSTWCTFGGG